MNKDYKMQNRPKEKKFECPACGMMSFPSKTGVFSQPKEEPKEVKASTPSPEDLKKLDNDCPACGMMSFPSNRPQK